MSQPYPSSSRPTGMLRPPAPAPVLTAVKLMYAGAAVSAVALIISLALIPAVKAELRTADPGLTAAQAGDLNVLIALAMAFGLAMIAAWVWLARAAGQGKNWARVVSGLTAVWLLWRPASTAFFRPGRQVPLTAQP